MAIRLDTLQKNDPKSTIDDQSPVKTGESTYVYKDLSLDVEFSSMAGNIPSNKYTNTTDLKDLRDVADVLQSLENLFNTIPGQRLTNPYFGLNLARYLFDPITKITADLIGRSIFEGVANSEPRIRIDQLDVTGYPDEQAYRVGFTLTFLDESIDTARLVGIVTSDGFSFQGGNI